MNMAARGHSPVRPRDRDRKSTRLNSSHGSISYAVFCLKKKNIQEGNEGYDAGAREQGIRDTKDGHTRASGCRRTSIRAADTYRSETGISDEPPRSRQAC